jgi:putative hydrolase of the HAD superfamily
MAIGEGDAMSPSSNITTLFLDIGGVLLTNGWDRHARQRAAAQFQFDYAEMDERHHLTFDTYEEGKLTLYAYLARVLFYEERPFTLATFKQFMFDQSRPFPDMINLLQQLKKSYHLKIAAVSNEGRELTKHRVSTFKLDHLIDFFVVSSFVHIRKPDEDIYRMALDMAQVKAEAVVYLDDRLMFVEVAQSLGIRAIHHTSTQQTRLALADFDLRV